MKKILIVSDAWHPQVNGVVTVLDKLTENLEKNDFTVRIVHPGLFTSVGLFFYPEIKIALFPRRKLEALILKENPDYIHIMTEGTLGFAAKNICRKHGFRFTTSYHTHFPLYIKERIGMLSGISFSVLSKFHNAGENTMVATKSLKDELEAHGFTNIVMWPLGVDVELFQRTEAPGIPDFQKPTFVYLGRIAVEKNIEEFLKLTLPGSKLVIGDGPDRARLEAKFKDVTFVGYKKGKELVEWLSKGDVFVFPSRTDTFGLAIVEALACGLPVAAHDVTGPKDIIENGVDGYLSEDLADAAKKCLNLSKEKCREKALKYSWEHSSEEFTKNLVSVRN